MDAQRMIRSMIVMTALAAQLQCAQAAYRVVTNYPNPFDSRSGSTTIAYTLASECDVRVTIYDLFGNIVREYAIDRQASGVHELTWDGTNGEGDKVAKGGYICVVRVLNEGLRVVATRKIGVVH